MQKSTLETNTFHDLMENIILKMTNIQLYFWAFEKAFAASDKKYEFEHLNARLYYDLS